MQVRHPGLWGNSDFFGEKIIDRISIVKCIAWVYSPNLSFQLCEISLLSFMLYKLYLSMSPSNCKVSENFFAAMDVCTPFFFLQDSSSATSKLTGLNTRTIISRFVWNRLSQTISNFLSHILRVVRSGWKKTHWICTFGRHCGFSQKTTHDSSTWNFRKHLEVSHPEKWTNSNFFGEKIHFHTKT